MKNICFIHIPKCGGTSVRSAMTKNWVNILKSGKISLDHVASADAAEKLGKDILSYREELLPYFLAGTGKTKYVLGHFRCTSLTRELFQDKWHFITFIRDPIKRWYSHYYFDRYRQNNLDYKKTDQDIKAYLDSTEGLQNARLYVRHFTDYVIGDELTESRITEAVENILKFDVFGILEKMDWFEEDYYKTTNTKLNVPKRNTNPKRDYSKLSLSDEVSQKVVDLCYYDMQIYEKVKAELNKRRGVQLTTG